MLEFWGHATLLKKTPTQVFPCEIYEILTQVFSCEIYEILRTIILKNICERLLLSIIWIETRTQVLSCEFCELFKNTYFLEDLQTASSETPVMAVFL